MAPLEPDFDPWADTSQGRGPQRNDPFDNAAAQSPFGASPETVGVPHMVRSAPRTGPSQTSRPTLVRALVLLLLLTTLAGVATSAYWLVAAWLP